MRRAPLNRFSLFMNDIHNALLLQPDCFIKKFILMFVVGVRLTPQQEEDRNAET